LAAKGLPQVVDAEAHGSQSRNIQKSNGDCTISHTICSASKGQSAELDPNPKFKFIYLYKYPSNITPVILPDYTTYEYGTDRVFSNVGT
jgi:hypothetical protein